MEKTERSLTVPEIEYLCYNTPEHAGIRKFAVRCTACFTEEEVFIASMKANAYPADFVVEVMKSVFDIRDVSRMGDCYASGIDMAYRYY